LLLEPSLEVVHQGARALLADALPNVGGTAAEVGFDGIKLGVSAQGFGGDRRTGRFVDVKVISPCVGIALSEEDAAVLRLQPFRERLVIGGLAVAVEDALEPG
jgi:hypothetical protein